MVGIITTLKEGQEHIGRMEPACSRGPMCAPMPVLLWSCRRPDNPMEMRSFGRTLRRWKHQIAAWHSAQVTNGPTVAVNNLIKSVKRGAVAWTSFHNYRIRSLTVQLGAARDDYAPLKSETPVNGAHLSL